VLKIHIVVFLAMTTLNLVGGYHRSEEHTAFLFRVEGTVTGNRILQCFSLQLVGESCSVVCK
jgi:hypothetical protein